MNSACIAISLRVWPSFSRKKWIVYFWVRNISCDRKKVRKVTTLMQEFTCNIKYAGETCCIGLAFCGFLDFKLIFFALYKSVKEFCQLVVNHRPWGHLTPPFCSVPKAQIESEFVKLKFFGTEMRNFQWALVWFCWYYALCGVNSVILLIRCISLVASLTTSC